MKLKELRRIGGAEQIVLARYIDTTQGKEDFSGMYIGQIAVYGGRRDPKIRLINSGISYDEVSLDETITTPDETNIGIVDVRDCNRDTLYDNPNFRRLWEFPLAEVSEKPNWFHKRIASILNGYGVHFTVQRGQ